MIGPIMEGAISPVDTEYRECSEPLAKIFSEYGLMERRVRVEAEYLISLSEESGVDVRDFSDGEKDMIRDLYKSFSPDDAKIIKDIEVRGYKKIKATNHDVKAVEYFIKDKLSETSLNDSLEWIHFALTSEDINNLAYGLMMKECVDNVYVDLLEKCKGDKKLKSKIRELKDIKIGGKLTGATGNFNAHVAAYPDVDWIKFSERFVSSFGLEPKIYTTQIVPRNSYSSLFQIIERVNNNFSKDVPLEEDEKNLSLSTSLFRHFRDKLSKSRLQRDLSCSTVLRNLGVAFAYSIAGFRNMHTEIRTEIPDNIIPVSPLNGRYYSKVKELDVEGSTGELIRDVYLPNLDKVIEKLHENSLDYKAIEMIARTHGQRAVGTTVGKEYMNFEKILAEEREELYNISLGDEIEKEEKIYQTIIRVNDALQDLDRDFWRYISDDWFAQEVVEGEVGSSTMAQKVNPIDFENSEGNTGVANVFLNHYVDFWAEGKEGLAYSLISLKNTLKGLNKVYPNKEKIKEALNSHPEILSEAYQTILRREGAEMPYEQLRDLTRGKKVTIGILYGFVDELDISDEVKEELKGLTPENYIGLAKVLVETA